MSVWRLTLLLLVVSWLTVALTVAYMLCEHTSYFWDFALHEQLARGLQAAWDNAGVHGAFRYLNDTLKQEYNALFALATVPVMSLFGGSRIAYIIGLTLPFLTLWIGGCWMLLHQAGQRPVSLWPLFLVMTVPPPWTTALRGMPDIAALGVFTIAIASYLRGTLTVARAVMVGILCGLTFVLRKTFLFSVGAFFVAALFDTFVQQRARIGALVVAALTTVATILLLQWRFLLSLTRTSYGRFYGSYLQDPLTTGSFLLGQFGGVAIGLAALGHCRAWRAGPQTRRLAMLLSVTAGVWFLFWVFLARQVAFQYALGPLAVWIAIGLAFAASPTMGSLEGRVSPVRPLIAAALLAVLLTALLPAQTRRDQLPLEVQRLALAAPYGPMVRTDTAELQALASELKTSAGAGGTVYVVAASGVLNASILIDTQLRAGSPRLPLLPGPEIDGRDGAPYDIIAQADIVVLPSTFQGHLPRGQNVVQSVDALLRQPWFRSYFTSHERRFTLEYGVNVEILERSQRIPAHVWATAVEWLHERLPDIPGYERPERMVAGQGFG